MTLREVIFEVIGVAVLMMFLTWITTVSGIQAITQLTTLALPVLIYALIALTRNDNEDMRERDYHISN